MSDPTTDRPAIGMPCPRCRVDLVMSDRQGVEIDYCPQCRGVWLDRGELDKIIERNAAFQGAPPPDPAVTQAQPPIPAAPSPWVAPVGGAPGYAPGAPPPPGWGQGYDQHGGYGGHGGGHGSGHGGGHGGSRDGHNNSFLGRLFR